MAPTEIRLQGRSYTVAKPWADLGARHLERSLFFHHATYTPVHQDLPEVMRLMGAADDDEMLVSILARELAPGLGSIQNVPISLGASGTGNELLTSGGRVLANVGPTAIRKALGGDDGPLGDLRALRDRYVDRMYEVFKEHGSRGDRRLIDAWVRSRDDVRNISQDLLGLLDSIEDNNEDAQATAAVVLTAMNISPVVTMRSTFGGDNHVDPNLEREVNGHVDCIGRVKRMLDELDGLRSSGVVRNDVLVGSINVFGRTLRKKGIQGRDHNRAHHVTVMFGDAFRGQVVGGIERVGKDYGATSIDAQTGAARGNIPFEETFASMAKTLGVAMGVPRSTMDARVKLGQVVEAA
ncbi:MAG: hypothetical protein AAFU79_37070, partial [Myxococcota bacterium]